MKHEKRITLIRSNQPVQATLIGSKGQVLYTLKGQVISGVATKEEIDLGKKINKKLLEEQTFYLQKVALVLHHRLVQMINESTISGAYWKEWDVPFEMLGTYKKNLLLDWAKPLVPAYIQRDKYKQTFKKGLVSEMIDVLKDISYNDIVDKKRINKILDQISEMETSMTQLLFYNKALYGLVDAIKTEGE